MGVNVTHKNGSNYASVVGVTMTHKKGVTMTHKMSYIIIIYYSQLLTSRAVHKSNR